MEEALEPQPESPDEATRTIWIRCHPTIFSLVFSTLKEAVSLTLDTMKKSPLYTQNSYSVEVVDLRDSINVFEITGPKSSQVIHGALTPTIANQKDEFRKVKQTKRSRLSHNLNVSSSTGLPCLTCKTRVPYQVTWSLASPFWTLV
jgi:hypothetical protein